MVIKICSQISLGEKIYGDKRGTKSPSLLLSGQREKAEPENKTEGVARNVEGNPEVCCSQ